MQRSIRRRGATLALGIAVALAPTTLVAQAPMDDAVPVLRADPAELGLRLPEGKPKPGRERRAVVQVDDEIAVAKVLVEVEDHLAVILPDGRIAAVPTSEATFTDRPFTPLTSETLQARLAKKFTGFKIKATKHFLYVYNSSEKFFQGTSGILESMYPGLVSYLRLRKIPTVEPEYPLVVVMFQTRKEWEDYMHGMFAGSGVAAFYDGVTNRVLMYEQSELADIAPELALKECISTVAHEGVHQILHNIGVQQRLSRWPMWISEGLPEYFAPTSIGTGLRWKGAGQVNDMRMRSMVDNIKTRTKPAGSEGATSLTEWIIAADRIDADGYAWSWALTHFLGEKRRDPFQKYLAEVSQLAPLEPPGSTERKLMFVKHFGDDFKKLDADLLTHLYKLPYVDPIESMTHYVIVFDMPGRRRYAITTSPKAIQETRAALLEQIPPRERKNYAFRVQAVAGRTAAQNFIRANMSGR